MFGKTYELSLNKDYVRHWGVVEAIRELIQNALDSDSPFVYELSRDPDHIGGAYGLSLTSEHAQLTPSSLLLGSTSKAEATDKIGSFGEGYKIALLVLTREGRGVVIENGDRLWTPFFRWSNKFNDDLLCIEESTNPMRQKGLTFRVSGLSSDEMDAVIASCLQMQDHIGAILSTPKGDILLERPGKLYVGGLYICDTDLKHGYNVKPEFIRLERDRKTVDSWDLKTLTRDMWYATGDMARVAELIEAETPDLEYARYSAPEMVKEACYQLFRQKNPGAILAESNEQLKALVKQGLTNVVYLGGGYSEVVRSARSYRTEVHVAPPPTPTEVLEAWYKVNRYHIHADSRRTFDDLLRASKNWRLT